MRAALTLPLLLLALAGCARPTTCDVVSFHQLPPPAGETIHVAPANAALGASAAFASTAAMIEQRLADLGYRPVADAEGAELVAHISYGIEPAGSRSLTVPTCSFLYHFGVGRPDRPYWYGYRCRPQPAVSAPLYARHLETRITGAAGAELFNGIVRSVGADDSLPDVMPYLVAAMFTNFPGESGVVKTVTIDEDSVAPAVDDQAAGAATCVTFRDEEAHR